MKIIFLDIDGVLTSIRSHIATNILSNSMIINKFDPLACAFLRDICRLDSNIKIVITSSWRKTEPNLENILIEHGLLCPNSKFDWKTPIINDAIRGNEIKAWLDSHSSIDDYIILDDDADMLTDQMSHLIQTSWENGLLFEHMTKIKERFKL